MAGLRAARHPRGRQQGAADQGLGAQRGRPRRPDARRQPRADPEDPGHDVQDRVRPRVATLHAGRGRAGLHQLRAGRGRHEPAGRSDQLTDPQSARHRLRPDLVGQPVHAQRRPQAGQVGRAGLVQAALRAADTVADQRQRGRGRQRRDRQHPDGAGGQGVRRAGARGGDARRQIAAARLHGRAVQGPHPLQPHQEPGRPRPRRAPADAADAGRQRLRAGRHPQVRR